MDTDTVFLFPPFWLDMRREQLWRGVQVLALRPKTFAVLQYLVAQAGQVVTQDALLDAVWGQTAVSETVVRRSIRELRTILGDSAQHPQFIQTVHRRGYRFIAPVTVTNTPPSLIAPTSEALRSASLPAQPAPEAAASPTELSLDEEYKLVTVLCCAVTDAPRLAIHRGPEAMHRLMQAFFEAAQEVIRRYDGTIMYITGEDFTAVFGAPIGQEDHARRAVLAALDLGQHLRAHPLGEGHAPRMGLHTGPIVVGGFTHALHQPYTAVGDTLHQANQLLRLAPPGAILMSAATHRLVQEEVRDEAHGALAANSPGGPLPVYTLQGLMQRRAGVAGQGARYQSRFVGRERELALLHERLAYAVQGHGQVVGVGGEPGMGKSRLLAEFHRSLAGQAVFYREGHCLPYSSTTPYLPVCDLFRQGGGITEADGLEVITTKVRRYLEDAQLRPEDDAALLFQLLDVPVDDERLTRLSPQERKVRTFALLRHLVLHDCQQRPLVLVVENLHWADATSEEWLTALIEHLTGAAILLLVTHRPGYRPPWLGQSVATQLTLPRLLPEDSRAVVQSVLRTTSLPEPLLQAIVTQAAGNPFFLEELTWVALEPSTSPAALGMPDTIQGGTGSAY
jgi:class 3 adenylate cyclase